jgi:hypothetical protein
MADTITPSFARDIRPMFTDMDIDHMHAMLDLSDWESVLAHADAIYAAVSTGSMPPTSSGEARWTTEMCETFKRWKDQGGKP